MALVQRTIEDDGTTTEYKVPLEEFYGGGFSEEDRKQLAGYLGNLIARLSVDKGNMRLLAGDGVALAKSLEDFSGEQMAGVWWQIYDYEDAQAKAEANREDANYYLEQLAANIFAIRRESTR